MNKISASDTAALNGANETGSAHRPSGGRKIALWSAILLPVLLGAAGCISSGEPEHPSNTTVIVPPGTTVTCQDGSAPPCR
jgi:hypothetical protein